MHSADNVFTSLAHPRASSIEPRRLFTAVAAEAQNRMIAMGSVAAKHFRGKLAVLMLNGEDKLELAKSMGLTTTTPGVVR